MFTIGYRRSLESLLFPGGLLVIAGLHGLIRWSVLSHPTPTMVVPVFASADSNVALEVQRIITTTLRDHLGPGFPGRILSIPEVIGPEATDTAAVIRKRLGALFILHGEVRLLGGSPAVYARVMGSARGSLTHFDPHTQDVTPQRTLWQYLLIRLTPARNPDDTEYPFEFTTEAEALLRSLEGLFELWFGDPHQAERLFRNLLEPLASSESHAVDELRLNLADALQKQGRPEEAVKLLRKRASSPTASAELLRRLATMLRQDPSFETTTQEAIDLLRQAAADKTDPQRDMTLYNLEELLVTNPSTVNEGQEIIRHLLRSSSHYRRAWYVKRSMGVWHWFRALEVQDASPDEARRSFLDAGIWYSRAIRARPKFVTNRPLRLVRFASFGHAVRMPPRFRRIRVPPIMHANASDGYRHGGAPLRARWYWWLSVRGRKYFTKKGRQAAGREDWDLAIASFAKVVVGHRDKAELVAEVSCFLAERALGHQDEAALRLHNAATINREDTIELVELMTGGAIDVGPLLP